LQHDPHGLPYRGIRLDRYNGRRHHVLGFHGGASISVASKLSRLSRRHLIYIKPVAAKEAVAGSCLPSRNA
jgi:hypothetical protein